MEATSKLKNIKLFGGIGAILTLLIGVPNVGLIFWLAGVILLFIAVKSLADISQKREIFRDYLLSFILGVVALIIFIGGIIAAAISMRGAISPEMVGEMIISFLKKAALFVLVSWILLIFSGYFFMRCCKGIATVTKVNLFETTGILSFVGAISSIILVGFLLTLIAEIFLAISFFSLPEELSASS